MSNSNASLAMQRITKLVDEASFMEIGSLVTSRSTDFNIDAEKAPSDGVIIGHGLIDGNLVFVYSQDSSVLGGTIGEMHAEKIVRVYDMAMKMGAPVIGLIDCGGIRLQESVDALGALGKVYAKEVAASGVIPQISAVFGNCGGGFSAVPALSDFAFVEEAKGRMFVNSPDAIEGNFKDKCDTASAQFASEENGCVDFVGSEDDILASIRQLVCMLPANNEGDTYTDTCEDDLNRSCDNLAALKDDPRLVLAQVSDNGVFFETKKNFAKNMVTGFVKFNGMTVGAVANCTAVYDEEGKVAEKFDSVLNAKGCNKAADFVNFCDAFSIPVVSFTNVTGFKNCLCNEKNLPKAMAKMVSAFANATCAKVNVITDKAFGTPYIMMNSKTLGCDMVYAWEDTKVGMMDSKIAAKIMNPDADAAEVAAKAKEYDALQSSVTAAAAHGYVDRIISPADTRMYLVAAFEMLYTKYDGAIEKKHGTK